MARDDGVAFVHSLMQSHTSTPSDDLREAYEQRAQIQYSTVVPPPDPALDRKFQRICELLAEQLPCRRYLDAGCGDGRYLVAVAGLPSRPGRVAATDISERILEVAAAAAAGAGIEIDTARANLEALPYPDCSFDLVLCSQVVEHLLDPARGLAEIGRVLVPGGRAIVTTDHRRNVVTKTLNLPRTIGVRAFRLRGRHVPVTFPHRDFRLGEIVRLVGAAGLEVEHTETFRFSLRRPLDWRPAVRALNELDRRLPRHRLGDIVAVVARRPN